MKNTKLIALVAVLVVVTLVVSVVISTSTTNKKFAEVQQTVTSYEEKIDLLNKTIDQLNKGLIDANTALETLKNAGVELDNWNAATAALPGMLEALENVPTEFVAQFATDEDSDDAYENFMALYAYAYEVDGETVTTLDHLEGVFADAEDALYRATSVEEMTTIINNAKAALEALETKIEILDAKLAALEKGTVTLADFDNYLFVAGLLENVIASDILPEVEEGEDDPAELYEGRMEDLFAAFQPIAVEDFIAKVELLPEVALVTLKHQAALKAANDAYAVLDTFYEDLDEIKGKEFALAEEALGELNVHMEVLVALDGTVEEGEEPVEGTAAYINALIASFKKTTIKADIDTHTWINNLLAAVKTWETAVWTNGDYKYTVVTEDGYVADVYNLIDRTTLAGYVSAFEKVTADLKVAADAFINAVKALDKITPDSLDDIMAAYDLYDVAAGLELPSVIDVLCNYVDYTDDEGEPVDVIGVQDSLKLLTNTIHANHTWLVGTIKDLADSVKGAYIKCDCAADKDGKVTCTDETHGTYDLTAVADFDEEIVKIIAQFGLDETVFDADLLAIYKAARINSYIEAAKANVEAANEAYPNESLVARYNAQIAKITADYTFAAEYTCVDPENKDHKCNCADDLANWDLAIVNDPVKTLTENFDLETLKAIFADAQ